MKVEVELNPEFQKALTLMEETTENVFVTGKAGTGKSTLLQYFREKTKKQVAVLAPTGVAALNVKGETIHSFFHFKPDITPEKAALLKPKKTEIYKKIDAIIIDEISMVRADLLDCINAFLKKHGKKKKALFGGIQLIFIGDLYQLPPVVTYKEKDIFKEYYKSPYFFDAKCFEKMSFTLLELEKVYRQKDSGFIELLNAIRNNSVDEKNIKDLNSRVGAKFEKKIKGYEIYLTTTNDAAFGINSAKMAELPGEEKVFNARITGELQRNQFPSEEQLTLKKGARVMFLNNDTYGYWVNGTLGEVEDIIYDTEEGGYAVWVKLQDGSIAEVYPNEWDVFHFSYDKVAKKLVSETAGSFIQYPLRPAWAVTIHKSQGKTFNKVIVDIGKGAFAHGQVYVALSRCTSFEGLSLVKRIEKKHIFADWRIVNFMAKYKYDISEKEMPFAEKITFITGAIRKKSTLKMVYLKSNDIKSVRRIRPLKIAEMEFMGKTFTGLRAFCFERNEERTFRIDRILKIEEAENKSS